MLSWYLITLLVILVLGGCLVGCLRQRKCLFGGRALQESKPSEGALPKSNEGVRLKLVVDVDTSPLTMPRLSFEGDPYYILFDTETAEVVAACVQGRPIGSYTPIALSWQVLSSASVCLWEECHILRQEACLVSAEATALHGIYTKQMLRGASPSTVLARLVNDFLRCKVVVAHNLVFHLGVLEAEIARQGMSPLPLAQMGQLCTMLWGEQLGCKRGPMGQRVYPSLVELFSYLHYGHLGAEVRYRSKPLRDVRLLAACLRKIISSSSSIQINR